MKKAERPEGLAAYIAVTAAYWAFMLTDGALRMLVLLHFNTLGFSPVQLAYLFVLYEIAGVITNLSAGWIAARFGLTSTLYAGLAFQVAALVALSNLAPKRYGDYFPYLAIFFGCKVSHGRFWNHTVFGFFFLRSCDSGTKLSHHLFGFSIPTCYLIHILIRRLNLFFLSDATHTIQQISVLRLPVLFSRKTTITGYSE